MFSLDNFDNAPKPIVDHTSSRTNLSLSSNVRPCVEYFDCSSRMNTIITNLCFKLHLQFFRANHGLRLLKASTALPVPLGLSFGRSWRR